MKTSDFAYDLPKELIAQVPLENRSDSRLMVLGRTDGKIGHGHFTDVLNYLEAGDCLVRNNTRVIPARLFGVKKDTGAVVEILLLRRRSEQIDQNTNTETSDSFANCCAGSNSEQSEQNTDSETSDGTPNCCNDSCSEQSEHNLNTETSDGFLNCCNDSCSEQSEHNLNTETSDGFLNCCTDSRSDQSEHNPNTETEDKNAGNILQGKNSVIWETLVRPGKKLRPGAIVEFGEGLMEGEIVSVLPDGNRLVKFFFDGIWEELLDKLGQMPLPPYITHKLEDKNRYQTIYAKYDGSAAAPTAGLHFTESLFDEIRKKGVDIADVTLHVGLGTFRPVKVEDVNDHKMHSEWYEIDETAAAKINAAKEKGGRVICVGTTSCRTIESAADETGKLSPCSGETDIFIYPGYKFKLMDALITNFHLPESTLLMLVSAFAGRENVLKAYKEAVRECYRFFSFGDAMLII